LDALSGCHVEENTYEESKMLSVLENNISRRGQKKEDELSEAEPIDKFVRTVKNDLVKFKKGLAENTAVENVISSITQRYLAKYASDGKKNAHEQALR